MGISQRKTRFTRVLLDTNIIVDMALDRQPYFRDSERVLRLVEESRIEGYISASTLSDLDYIIRKGRERNGH
jgi:predicted nucleic acid-binding protein